MTKQRNSDLKARMMALRVNEPLKLKNEALVFAPPKEKNEPAQIEVPVKNHTSIEQPQSERAQLKGVDPEYPQNEGAQNRCAKGAKDTKSTKVEAPQVEPPQKEASGFFKLSHAVFWDSTLRELSGDSFRLFLWLSSRAWRFPTSDGTVRASVSFMESQAGMSHATISRSLKKLKETGLISVVEVDFKKGNLWKVSSVASSPSGTDPEGRLTQKKQPQYEAPHFQSQAASNRETTQLTLIQLPPQNEQDLRIYKKSKKIKKETPVVFFPTSEQEMKPILQCSADEAVASFEAYLPNEKQSFFITRFMEREYPHGFFPPAKVIKKLVATEWYLNQGAARQVRSA